MNNGVNPIFVCFGKSCVKRGAREVAETLQSAFDREGIPAEVHRHTCFDLCKQACNVMLETHNEQRIYTNIHPKIAHKTAAQMIEGLVIEGLEEAELEVA